MELGIFSMVSRVAGYALRLFVLYAGAIQVIVAPRLMPRTGITNDAPVTRR
jgi:hypothetical protein